MHRFVAIQVESEGDNEDLVTTKQMFRNIWSRIVSIEALTQQIKELTATLTFPREVFKLLREMPEFSQINFQPEAKISKFIKSNDGQWRCEVARPGSSVTVSATIDIDLSYPEIPPIFKL
jgi:aspartokinase